MDRISVVIPTKNRPQDIMVCLESILAQTLLPDEIVIVDSSDTGELKPRLSSLRDKINTRYIHATANLARARNIGIDNSRGDIIAFVDDDDILDKDYLREIKNVFNNDSEGRVGGVTGEKKMELRRPGMRFLLPVYQIFARVFLLWRYGDGKLQASGLPKLIRPGTVNKPIEVEYLVGYSMSFRRKVINEFRFDEEMPHFDDDDIGYRIAQKYKNIYAPGAKFVHNAAARGGHGERTRRMMTHIREFHRFSKKNLPQTPKHKLALYWAGFGYVIRRVAMGLLSPYGNP